MSPIALLLKATSFSAHKHRDQRRKGPDAHPYINHPIEVAELLARVGGVTDPTVLVAAILHDTIEDTETTPAELEDLFGRDVADEPAKGWPLQRRVEYVNWAERVVAGCRGVNAELERMFDEEVRRTMSPPVLEVL